MNTPPPAILNVSAYRFVTLHDLESLRAAMLGNALEHGLKGTILLADEGINLFLAGSPDSVRAFLAFLSDDALFAGCFVALRAKESWSEAVPFKRLLVKIKREIIRMNRPAVRPQAGRAPSIGPAALARWLEQGHDDAGREVVMLDTRNAFEIELGGFDGALDWKLQRFSDFPAALESHRNELEGKTVVSYCTGGIRCEKAALLMIDAGLPNVLQLDGGILDYLEAEGGRFYRGECFVFDERLGVDARLNPSARPLPAAAQETE